MEVSIVELPFCPATGPPRTPGIHLSSILRALAVKLGHFEAGDDFNRPQLSLGLVWESHLAGTIRAAFPCFDYQPGEVMRDGIAGTLDGLGVTEDGEPFVWECKLTWYSFKRGITSWYWQQQNRAYCYLAGTTLSLYSVLWVNGDYKSGLLAQQAHYWVRWDREELEHTWRMIVGHKHLGVREGEQGS